MGRSKKELIVTLSDYAAKSRKSWESESQIPKSSTQHSEGKFDLKIEGTKPSEFGSGNRDLTSNGIKSFATTNSGEVWPAALPSERGCDVTEGTGPRAYDLVRCSEQEHFQNGNLQPFLRPSIEPFPSGLVCEHQLFPLGQQSNRPADGQRCFETSSAASESAVVVRN